MALSHAAALRRRRATDSLTLQRDSERLMMAGMAWWVRRQRKLCEFADCMILTSVCQPDSTNHWPRAAIVVLQMSGWIDNQRLVLTTILLNFR